MLLLIFLEKEREEEKKHQCESDALTGCLPHTLQLGTEPTIWVCAPTGLNPATFFLGGEGRGARAGMSPSCPQSTQPPLGVGRTRQPTESHWLGMATFYQVKNSYNSNS